MSEWLLNLKKKQTKSENHEICRDIEISYVEIAIENWVRFAKVDTYVAYKLKHASPNKFYEC